MHISSAMRPVLESDADVVVVITLPASHAEARLRGRGGQACCGGEAAGDGAVEARRVVDEARAAGRHLMVSPFVQLSPAFRALWTAIAATPSARALGLRTVRKPRVGRPGTTPAGRAAGEAGI
jgi:hypothetical protein